MRHVGLTLLVIFCLFTAKGQFTLEEIKVLELGQKFFDAKQILTDKFGNNISVHKGNAYDTYKIEAPKKDSLWVLKQDRSAFDIYGDCQYSFKFAKDVLIGVDIRFEFLATNEGKENFAKLLNEINANFSKDQDLHSINTSGENLDTEKIIADVNNRCDAKQVNEEYFKQSAMMGMKAWEIHKRVNDIPKNKFLSLQLYKSSMSSVPYSGCVAVIELTISNEAFIGLYNQVSGMKIKYEPLSDD